MSEVKTPFEYGKMEVVHHNSRESGLYVGTRIGAVEQDEEEPYDFETVAERVAACWNGCRRIADPSAVEDLLAALQGLLAVIADSDRHMPPSSVRLLGIVSSKQEFAAVDAARAALRKVTGGT